MKAKFVTAETEDAAMALAEKHFGCDRNYISFEVVSGHEGAASWQLLAFVGSSAQIANQDASYEVYYESDGVYLEVYEKRGAGRPLHTDELMLHLSRKNISGLNSTAAHELASRGSGRVRIASAQNEYIYGEDLKIHASNDEMKAHAQLLAPEQGGAFLDYNTALQKVNSSGITHGINEEALKELLDAKDYGESKLIAEALDPVNGDDGKLIFHFHKDEKTGRPKEIGGGRVDFRTLDLFEPVQEGQLLVTRILATEGAPGATVKGKSIKHKPGKDTLMPRGKNIDVNPEKTEMSAKCSGMVQFINSSVNVSNLYKINGDCDIGVGNIDFDGSVQISGCVRSGHTIKATGSVVVAGVVEAATIIAGGNVEIKSGMQGGDKGRIEAGGNITALYIERGTAIADGSMSVDVSIKSILEVGGSLIAKGKRGAIIGGRASVAESITANYIGALSNVQTEVEVGAMPRKRARLQALEKEMERISAEMVKLDQLDAYLAKTKGKMDQATWDKLYLSGGENRRTNQQALQEDGLEVNDLKHEIEHATEGKVHVLNNVYAGTRIIIANDTYKVTDDIQYATFRYRNGEIIYGPCEKSKS